MELFNRALAQLTDLFKSLTPGARLTAALLLVVTVVSLAWLFNEQAGGEGSLMGGETFSAAQLRSMHAALGKADVEARIDGAQIKVPRGQESKAMAALAEAGALPVDFGAYLEKAVAAGGLMALGRNQVAAAKIARQRELQNIINTMVERSAVLIDEQSDHGFPPKTIITASVSIQPRDAKPIDEARIPAAIRYLVASSVAGLKPEAVTVVDLSTGRVYPGNGGDGKSPGLMGDYAQAKRYHEHEFQQMICHLLAYIPGVLVTASVELDPEISNEQTSIEYDDGKSLVRESRDEADPKTLDGSPRQPPGALVMKQPRAGRSSVAPSEAVPQAPPQQAVPTTQKHVVREGHTPKRVAVSVSVPSSYYEKIWRKMNANSARPSNRTPDPTDLAEIQAAETRKIEALVAPLLPQQEPAAGPTPVTVTTFDQFAEPSTPRPELKDALAAWALQHAGGLGMAALALVGLVVLRSMIRTVGTTAAERPADSTLDASLGSSLMVDDAHLDPPDGSARERLRRRAAAVPELRDELSDAVREDPQAAVSILRSWIGNAG